LLARDPKEVCAQRAALRVEAKRAAPDLSECFLHDVLGGLFISKKVSEKSK
jgi:hypothetical protein